MGLSGVTWVKSNFDTIFTALATGQKFDAVAAASTITPERAADRRLLRPVLQLAAVAAR